MKETRRDFLKKTGGCALGMAGLATQMHHLGMVSAFAQKAIDAQADTPDTTYQALVLLFWAGGNDGNNMIIPNHNDSSVSNYANYAAVRQASGLAIDQATLLPIAVPRINNLSYGFHPALGPITGGINNGIHELFGMGKLAIVTNVGNLVRPMTKTQYQNGSVQKPYQLFSHSDQVAQAQTSISNQQAFTGWGGRVSDRMTPVSGPLIPMITSIAGAQLFTAGQTTLPLAIADSGTSLAGVLAPAGYGFPTPPSGVNLARFNALNALRTQDLSSEYIRAASHVTDLAIQANNALQTFQEVTVTFPNTSIGRQLKQIARLIKKRNDLSISRQVFYCQIGGFDTHTNEIPGHTTLFGQFSQAMRAFYDEMIVQGISNDVTTFSLSDFGRTMTPSGSGATVGSDHAWGNHMFVMGGSVAGGDFYGSLRPDGTGTYFPNLTPGSADDTDSGTTPRGRWIPTTSVDQYASVLARWFGLPQDPGTLAAVFPNLTNFPGSFSQLGFLP